MTVSPLPSDSELLQRFVRVSCGAAFRELVSRYSGLVLAVARRRTSGNWHAAEDIAQSVFSGLAQEAKKVRGETLGAWLYRRTLFAAAHWCRSERRRLTRESVAVELTGTNPQPTGIPEGFDEAFGRLRERDQQMLLWRYVEELDYRTIGASLGISEDAAQKRAARALELLRSSLVRHGVLRSASALAGLLVAAAGRETVSAATQARWSAAATQSAHAAPWAMAGLALPALCLLTGVALPVMLIRPAPDLRQSPVTQTGAASGFIAQKSLTKPAKPPVAADLATLKELAVKGANSPLWMARLDRAVSRLSSSESRALMEELGYREDNSGTRPPPIIREKVVAHWAEVDPREAAVRLNLRERGVAYRVLGAENLAEAEQMIAALPEEEAKLESTDFKSAQYGLWKNALCGLAAKNLASALEQMQGGVARLELEWGDQLETCLCIDAAETNPEQTARILGQRLNSPAQPYRATALKNLAKTKARLAWSMMDGNPLETGPRREVEQAVFQAILKQDKKEAVRLAPVILGSRAVSRAQESAAALYADGFESAWALAEKLTHAEFREALLSQLGSSLARDKPEEAMKKFRQDDANPAFRELWWQALYHLAGKDPAAVMAVKINDSTKASSQIQNIATALAQKDPDAAQRWLDALPDSCKAEAEKIRSNVAQMRTDADPKTRAEEVLTRGDAASQAADLMAVLQQWYLKDPAAARQFAARLSGTTRAAAMAGVLQAVGVNTLEGLAAAKPILTELAQSREKLPAAAGYAVSQVVQNWVQREPEQASAWINALPRGAVFDQAARGIAEGLRLTDPRDALTWVTAISDTALRNGMAQWILQDWSMADSDDARAAVEALAVPAQVKSAFLKHIRPTQ